MISRFVHLPAKVEFKKKQQDSCFFFYLVTRFPLYLLLHFVSQKDAAAIGARRKIFLF